MVGRALLRTAATVAMAALALACSSTEEACVDCDPPRRSCGPEDVAHAELVTISPGTGGILDRTEIRFTYTPVEERAGTLFASGHPSPLATIATAAPKSPSAPPPVSNEPGSTEIGSYNVLRGTGDNPWRRAHAAGKYLMTTANGTAVVLGFDRRLRGIRVRDGRQEWNIFSVHGLAAIDAQASGSVVLGIGNVPSPPRRTSPGRVFALDPDTGRFLWIRAMPSQVLRPRAMALVEDRVVVAASPDRAESSTASPFVLAFDARDGAIRWTSTLPREVVNGLFLTKDELVVVNQDRGPNCEDVRFFGNDVIG